MNIKILAALNSIVLVVCLIATQAAIAEVIDLDHAEFAEKINTNPDIAIIDVRSEQEFASGHVPGAVNIPHRSILGDLTLLDSYKDKEMVFYCRSGKRAKTVTDALESDDYTSGRPLYHLDGDILGWISADQPLQK